MKKITTKEFIKRSNKIHNNIFNYDKTSYNSCNEKVIITCKKHGDFLQLPSSHLTGSSCRLCAIAKQKYTSKEICILFNKKHNNLYNYSLVNYINSNTPVIIICKIHGKFLQKPTHHLRGQGCRKCNKPEKIDKKNFIKKAILKHGNKFDYSNIKYTKYTNQIKLTCMIHGKFITTPYLHINSEYGCQKCSKYSHTLEKFIQKSNFIHNNKYDYSKTKYIIGTDKVKIICKKHGIFLQNANSHLAGRGCPNCHSKISKIEIKWLDYLNIKNEYRHKSIILNNKRYNFDAFDKNTNTIYEFYGDFWHGNIKVFNPEKINKLCKKTFQELYLKTLKREIELIYAGYNLITIWENDFKCLLKKNS